MPTTQARTALACWLWFAQDVDDSPGAWTALPQRSSYLGPVAVVVNLGHRCPCSRLTNHPREDHPMQPTRIPKPVAELRRRHQAVDREAGQAVSEVVMYSAVIVGVIVVIGAALQALGVDLVGRIGDALGI